jgi:hypothetical protein
MQQVAGCTSVNNQLQVAGAGPSQAYQQASQNTRNGFMPFNAPPLVKGALTRLGIGQSNPQPANANPPPPQFNPQHAADNPSTYDPYNGHAQGGTPYNAPPQGGSPYNAAPPTRDTEWRTSPPSYEPMTRPASHTVPVIAASQSRPAPQPAPQPPPYSMQAANPDGPPVIARSDAPPIVTPEPSPYARPAQAEPPLYGEPILPPPVKNEPLVLPQAHEAKLPKLSTQQLRQRIERACAGAVRNVSVEYDAADKLNVKMLLLDGAQQQQVIERVFGIPELLPYQGQIQISLDLPAPPAPMPAMQEAPRR